MLKLSFNTEPRKTINPNKAIRKCAQSHILTLPRFSGVTPNQDEGKEIVYNGEIYDVKEKCVEGGLVTFHCLKDAKEKKLLAELNDHVRNNIDTKSPQHDKNPGKQLQKNISEYLLSDMKVVPFYLSSQEIPFSYSEKLIGCYSSPLTVPPEVSFS